MPLPHTLGKYHLVGEADRGGFAVIYRAFESVSNN